MVDGEIGIFSANWMIENVCIYAKHNADANAGGALHVLLSTLDSGVDMQCCCSAFDGGVSGWHRRAGTRRLAWTKTR